MSAASHCCCAVLCCGIRLQGLGMGGFSATAGSPEYRYFIPFPRLCYILLTWGRSDVCPPCLHSRGYHADSEHVIYSSKPRGSIPGGQNSAEDLLGHLRIRGESSGYVGPWWPRLARVSPTNRQVQVWSAVRQNYTDPRTFRSPDK